MFMHMSRDKTLILCRIRIGRCIKLIVSWRSSSDEQAGRDHMKVFEKVVVKVNLKELVLNKLASYVYSYTIILIMYYDYSQLYCSMTLALIVYLLIANWNIDAT